MVIASVAHSLSRKLPFTFDLTAVTLDQGQPDLMLKTCARYAKWALPIGLNIETRFRLSETPDGKTYCALCSKMRRASYTNFS